MKFDMVNPDTLRDCQTIGQFRVGNYVLKTHRTCEQTRRHLGLSKREIELLMWIGAGLKKREIAERMGVSPATADTFRRRAYAKLGVGTGSAAVAIISAYLAGTEVDSKRLEPAT